MIAYSIHNAWNCFVFLNFVDDGAARQLMGASEGEIATITSLGWVGIFLGAIVATFTRKHLTMFWVGAAFNIFAPILRYFVCESVFGVIVSNVIAGLSFGVFSTWPVMLAAMWPQAGPNPFPRRLPNPGPHYRRRNGPTSPPSRRSRITPAGRSGW